MKYKVMKVFDCQDMPEDVKKIFFEMEEANNDCYVDWHVHSERFFYKDGQKEDAEYCEYVWRKQLVEDWLIVNGALPGKSNEHEGEHVLINHWW
jgi:hypothetical protein